MQTEVDCDTLCFCMYAPGQRLELLTHGGCTGMWSIIHCILLNLHPVNYKLETGGLHSLHRMDDDAIH